MTGLCSLWRGLLAHSFFPALCCISTSFQRPARWRTAAANLGSTEGHCAGGRGRDNAKHLSGGLREVSASKKNGCVRNMVYFQMFLTFTCTGYKMR